LIHYSLKLRSPCAQFNAGMLAVFNGSLTEKITIFDVPMMNDLKIARHIVVLTGAGISPESGIPTFRDAKSSLW